MMAKIKKYLYVDTSTGRQFVMDAHPIMVDIIVRCLTDAVKIHPNLNKSVKLVAPIKYLGVFKITKKITAENVLNPNRGPILYPNYND